MDAAEPTAYGGQLVQVWAGLDDTLKPFALMMIEAAAWQGDIQARHQQYRVLLGMLQGADIPVVVRITDGVPGHQYPLALAEELVREFGVIKGLQIKGYRFDSYDPRAVASPQYPEPEIAWMTGAVAMAARYGRFLMLQGDGLALPRLMANVTTRPLFDALRANAAYAAPVAGMADGHCIAALSAGMGLWIEGAAAQWGVAATSRWYANAGFIEPGVFGPPGGPWKMPPALYRAMVLNGVMTGATVYCFEESNDLWFGNASWHWEKAISPTLTEIVQRGLIARSARKKLVVEKARVGYQLAPAQTARDFHVNLRDIDGVYDLGLMIAGAYGMDRPGQMPELVPNSGRHYWVPLLSPYAPDDVRSGFALVAQPGVAPSAGAWTELLDQQYTPDGEGPAFISRVGNGIFILNTRENLYGDQTFRVPEVAAPVRGLAAERTPEGVVLTWPFREDDLSYSVYRRASPNDVFRLVAKDIDGRRWVDPNPPQGVAAHYALSALTNEREVYEGIVSYGEFLALSTVESRLEEEVLLAPEAATATATAIPASSPSPAESVWWPAFPGVAEAQRPAAEEIVSAVEALDAAFHAEDLDAVTALYSRGYEDPEGWQWQYVRRAYKWFFERYRMTRMDRQIRQWDFTEYETTGRVRLLLYCRFAGIGITDAGGIRADVEAWFPRTESGEVWITFAQGDAGWEIVETSPALPNFRDILSFSAGPFDEYPPGPDN